MLVCGCSLPRFAESSIATETGLAGAREGVQGVDTGGVGIAVMVTAFTLQQVRA